MKLKEILNKFLSKTNIQKNKPMKVSQTLHLKKNNRKLLHNNYLNQKNIQIPHKKFICQIVKIVRIKILIKQLLIKIKCFNNLILKKLKVNE